jgi:hypothetical protein
MRDFIEITTDANLEVKFRDQELHYFHLNIPGWDYRTSGSFDPNSIKIENGKLTALMNIHISQYVVLALSKFREGSTFELATNWGRDIVGAATVVRRWFEPTMRTGWKDIERIPPELRKKIRFKRNISLAEFERLKLGITPLSMEDKWYVFYENEWLFVHRSWTGHGVFELHIEAHRDSYRVTEAYGNSSFSMRVLSSALLNSVFGFFSYESSIFD